MRLGILVNTERNLEAVTGLVRAAVEKGHEVVVFTMDEGTNLFGRKEYTTLCGLEGVSMSFCSHNAEGHDAPTGGLPSDIVCGSQYDNAAMIHAADKVIVL